MRRFICMFLIVFLGAVLISGCQSSSDDLVEEVDSPEYLAFSSGESYQGDIFIMNEEGTVQKRLTDNSYDDYRPAWSPDGSSIAFISDRSGNGDAIYVMNADGSGVDQLISPINNITSLSWAPDGSKIIYSGVDISIANEYAIYYYDFVTQSRNVLISDSSINKYPDYSPEGDQFVFSSDRLSNTNLFIGENDGSIPIQLTAFSENDRYKYFPGEPVWSPDGDKIAFSLGIYDKNEQSAFSNICTIDSDGTNFRKLTNTTEVHNVAPAWSSDSIKIAFASIHEAGDIFIMNADGSNTQKLTNSPPNSYSTHPAWAPENFEMD